MLRVKLSAWINNNSARNNSEIPLTSLTGIMVKFVMLFQYEFLFLFDSLDYQTWLRGGAIESEAVEKYCSNKF